MHKATEINRQMHTTDLDYDHSVYSQKAVVFRFREYMYKIALTTILYFPIKVPIMVYMCVFDSLQFFREDSNRSQIKPCIVNFH